MASRAVKPNVASLQNNLQLIAGNVRITGPHGGVSSSIVLQGGIGLVPQVLSGSSPTSYVDQFPVVWLGSGSYALVLADLYPQLLAATFSPGLSGSVGDLGWTVGKDISVSPYDPNALYGAGASGSNITSVNRVPFFLAASGSKADPAAGETVEVDFHLDLANTTLTYPGGI